MKIQQVHTCISEQKQERCPMNSSLSKKRIWEIDFLRGLLIPGMILIHLIYDVVDLYGFIDWPYPAWYSLFKNNYGALFVMLSGISVTLGSRCVRRGLTVLAGGMICTVATVGMYLLHMAGKGIIIYFGVLHCLGVCMMLWPLFRRLPRWALVLTGVILVAAGWLLRSHIYLDAPWLLPLGFRYPGFSSSDYFPLMPNLGYFLLGAAIGKWLYAEKVTRFPNVDATRGPVRVLCAWGRNSLMIYLLHQPVLALGCQIADMLRKL